MSRATVTPPARDETIADLLERLGAIAPARVRLRPWPGTATEQDVIDIEVRENRLFELVDGVLVEKVMGFRESLLAAHLVTLLNVFQKRRNLGIVVGADGMIRLQPGRVRIPDVSFISWDRLPERKVPRQPIPAIAPDLAVEVLSKGNTKREMRLKLRDYFHAGILLIWYVDPRTRIVAVYTGPDQAAILVEDQTLDGGAVLPEFALPIRELFEEPAPPQAG